MKKIIITMLVMAMAAFSANAQWWAGGSLSYSYNAGTHAFTISPELGYNFSDQWTAAAAINLGGQFNGMSDNVRFTITPYARYSFWHTGIATLFVDGGLNGGVVAYTKAKDSAAVFGLGVRPGIALALSEKLCLVAHSGFLGWQVTGNIHQAGIGIDGQIAGVGLYYCF